MTLRSVANVSHCDQKSESVQIVWMRRSADEQLRRPGARRDLAQGTHFDISLHALFEHVMPARLQPANQTGTDWL